MKEYLLALRKVGLWLRRSFSFLWLILLAVYLTVLASQSVIRNYQSQQETKGLQTKLDQTVQERKRMEALLVYYQTDEYRDLVLRQSLLLRKGTEKLYMLPESSGSKSVEDEVSLGTPATPTTEPVSSQALWQQWLHYILHGQS